MTSLRIPPELSGRIELHAGRTYPEECCGVLLGTEVAGKRLVLETLEIDNSQGENRRRRFLVTPDQYRRAEHQAAERHLELLGFYHSHPDHPAAPSAFDTEHALPWFSYLIVSVNKGRADRATSWVLEETRAQFAEQPLAYGTQLEGASSLK